MIQGSSALFFRRFATFLNALSNSSLEPSASTSRAISMKRFDCSGSSRGGLGLRGIMRIISQASSERWAFVPMMSVPSERRGWMLQPHAPDPVAHADPQRLVGQMNRRGRDTKPIIAQAHKANLFIGERHEARCIARIVGYRLARDSRIHRSRGNRQRKTDAPAIGLKNRAFDIAHQLHVGHVEKGACVLNAKLSRCIR
jgi:hypothetical protein